MYVIIVNSCGNQNTNRKDTNEANNILQYIQLLHFLVIMFKHVNDFHIFFANNNDHKNNGRMTTLKHGSARFWKRAQGQSFLAEV